MKKIEGRMRKPKTTIDDCVDCRRKRVRIVDVDVGLCAKCKAVELAQIRASKRAVAAINAAIALGVPFVAEDASGGVVDEHTAAEFRRGRDITPRLLRAEVEWLVGRVRLQSEAGVRRDDARKRLATQRDASALRKTNK